MRETNLKKIVELRHRLHAHPELSMEETWTKRTLFEFLKENTELLLEDRGHWFYAYYDCKKPGAETIAFRADFDALPMEEKEGLSYGSQIPGVCHKCGHDGHSAALAGFALEVSEGGADKNIYFIFQHGEEIGGGGAECAELIPEKKISRIFAFHNMSGYPEGSIVLREGVAHCTSKGLTVHMKGTPAHASQPEDGKNPAAAISELVLYKEAAVDNGIAVDKRTAVDNGTVADNADGYAGFILATVVGVNIGSKNFGISASEGEVSMTLRADYEEDLNRMETRIRKKALELGKKYGLTVSFEEQDFFPETVNHSEAVRDVREAALGNGMAVVTLPTTFRASEDFGYYLKKCPGAIFYIGNGENYPAIHTHEFDFNDRILETAVDMFMALAAK